MKFYTLLTMLFLCLKSAMPMVVQEISKTEQLNYIRHFLLSRLIERNKSEIVKTINLREHRQLIEVRGDVYLSFDQYELIGTISGHLIIVKNPSSRLFDKIKVHRDSVSCLAAKGDIVATGSASDKLIRRWIINTFKKLDELNCQAPIIFMKVIGKHFFVVDVQGVVTLFDWESGIVLCSIETGISEAVLHVEMYPEQALMLIMDPFKDIRIKINLLVELDLSICSLNEEQIVKIYGMVKLKEIFNIEDANLPYRIRNLL